MAMPQQQSSQMPRRTGRVRFEDLRCDLGRIVDMSASGIGIVSRTSMSDRVGTMVGFRVWAPWCQKFVVGGEVRYSKRLGFMKHHVGMAFVNLPPETMRRLNELPAGAGSLEYGWGSTR